MKEKNKIFSTIVLFIAMTVTFTGFTQEINHEQHEVNSVARPTVESWRPINTFPAIDEVEQQENSVIAPSPLTNVLNGVHFYIMNAVCDSKNELLFKVINLNEYPVNVQWQLNPTSPKIVVQVPAMRDLSGNCSSTDENIKKLAIKFDDDNNPTDVLFVFNSIEVIK